MDNSLFTDILKFYSSSVFYGELVVILFFILVILWFKYFRNSGFVLFFEFIFETVYEFFEDILWKEEDRWIKVYVFYNIDFKLFMSYSWDYITDMRF